LIRIGTFGNLALTCRHPNSVTDLRPDDTAESPYLYTFKVQCTSCREIHPNWVSVSRFVRTIALPSQRPQSEATQLTCKHQDQNELSGSRGEANFVWRCRNCKVRPLPPPTITLLNPPDTLQPPPTNAFPNRKIERALSQHYRTPKIIPPTVPSETTERCRV